MYPGIAGMGPLTNDQLERLMREMQRIHFGEERAEEDVEIEGGQDNLDLDELIDSEDE